MNKKPHAYDYILSTLSDITLLPAMLFSQRRQRIIVSSVVWLYCIIYFQSSELSMTWSKDGTSLVDDIPDIRIRKRSHSRKTILRLELNNFHLSDGGTYLCTAESRGDIVTGTVLDLIGKIPVHLLIFDSMIYTCSISHNCWITSVLFIHCYHFK